MMPERIPSRREVAESLFHVETWIDQETASVKCPGESLHTHRTARKDCLVYLSPGKAPSVHCFHSSCSSAIQEANFRLRSTIGKAEAGSRPSLPKRRRVEIDRKEQARMALIQKAKGLSKVIMERFAWAPEEAWTSSPVSSSDQEKDHQLLLSLFNADDRIWIGNKPEDSGHERNFRTAAEWMAKDRAPGNFTCPATFTDCAINRSNSNVKTRRFLVVESDELTTVEQCSVYRWLNESGIMKLRALVSTGGKSVHAWFDFPREETLAELRIILPALRFDPRLFTASQPCRLPGAFRKEKGRWQSLIWFGGAS
jgi:hypothetical protein